MRSAGCLSRPTSRSRHSSYYESLLSTLRHKRELLETGLRRAGLVPMAGQGGILCLADTSDIVVPTKYLRRRLRLCRMVWSHAIGPSAAGSRWRAASLRSRAPFLGRE